MRFISVTNPKRWASVYAPEIRARLAALYDIADVCFTAADLEGHDFSDVALIFSTWGMPPLTEAQIARHLPGLRSVFYAAGTVQAFARPFFDRGVQVFSAWQANAVPVAEYTTAQILLANKGFFSLSRQTAGTPAGYAAVKQFCKAFPGNYRARVGIIGDGAVGSLVIDALRRYELDIDVFSITMTPARAAELGVRLVTLAQMFTECDVISNHLANNPQTVGMLSRDLIFRLKPYSTFINTGRGAQVDESALIDKLTADETITALLDVTYPEPPADGSLLYTLPNVILTPHIAGSAGNEVWRMAEYMLAESRRWAAGEPCRYEVSPKMLKTMA